MSRGFSPAPPSVSAAAADLLPFLLTPRAQRQPGVAVGAGAYALFILVNASLFVRPAEIVPSLEGWPIYAVLATLALAVALPAVLAQLTLRSLLERPISACVVGLLAAVVLSHLSSFFIWGARTSGMEFFKVLLYYLLLVGVIDSIDRLRRFMGWIVVLAVIVTGLTVLQYHGLIDIAALAAVEHGRIDRDTREGSIVLRIVSTGIFNDPNDLCLLLVLAMAACVHGFDDRPWGVLRICLVAPPPPFCFPVMVSQTPR